MFQIARPEELMAQWSATRRLGMDGDAICSLPASGVKPVANSFTYGQRRRLKGREQVQPAKENLKSEVFDPAYAAKMREQLELNSKGITPKRRGAAAAAWMTKLAKADYSGPTLDAGRYLAMRNTQVKGNPRHTSEYRKMCLEAVGLGTVLDKERYAHLKPPDFDVVRWVVSRGSGCMWLPDTPRTTVKGFRHRLITKGPPIRVKLFRLNRPDTEWIEKAGVNSRKERRNGVSRPFLLSRTLPIRPLKERGEWW